MPSVAISVAPHPEGVLPDDAPAPSAAQPVEGSASRRLSAIISPPANLWNDVVVSTRRDLQLHAIAPALAFAVFAVLAVSARELHEAALEQGDGECSQVEQLRATCSCDDDLEELRGPALMAIQLIWVPALMCAFEAQYRLAVGCMGRPRNEKTVHVAMVAVPSAANGLLRYVMPGVLAGGVSVFLLLLLAMLLWKGRSCWVVLRCVGVWSFLSVLALPYRLIFIEWLPSIARDDENMTSIVLMVYQLLLVSWSLFSARVLLMLTSFSSSIWPVAQQSLLLRLVMANQSATRIGLSLASVQHGGYRLADLTPWHPFILTQIMYLFAQLLTRQNVLTVVRNRLRGLSDEAIKQRQPPLLAIYGNAKDARYLAYLGILFAFLIEYDSGTHWSTLCTGEFHQFLPEAIGWVLVLLALELLTDVLVWLCQREVHHRNPATPFRSLFVTASFVSEACLSFYVLCSSIVGCMIGATAFLELGAGSASSSSSM